MAEENETEIICPLCMYGYILPDSPMVSTFLQKPSFSGLDPAWAASWAAFGLPRLPSLSGKRRRHLHDIAHLSRKMDTLPTMRPCYPRNSIPTRSCRSRKTGAGPRARAHAGNRS
jgi:hypothetical protein